MRRRAVITLLGSVAAMAPLALQAQAGAMPVIGYLSVITPVPDLLEELRRGLAESGFYEGQTVAIEYRSAEGRYDRLPGLAADLVRRRVDVIVTGGGTLSARAGRGGDQHDPHRGAHRRRSRRHGHRKQSQSPRRQRDGCRPARDGVRLEAP